MMASETISVPAEQSGGTNGPTQTPGLPEAVLPEHLRQFAPLSERQLAFIAHLKRITNPDVWPTELAMRKVRASEECALAVEGIIKTCRQDPLYQR